MPATLVRTREVRLTWVHDVGRRQLVPRRDGSGRVRLRAAGRRLDGEQLRRHHGRVRRRRHRRHDVDGEAQPRVPGRGRRGVRARPEDRGQHAQPPRPHLRQRLPAGVDHDHRPPPLPCGRAPRRARRHPGAAGRLRRPGRPAAGHHHRQRHHAAPRRVRRRAEDHGAGPRDQRRRRLASGAEGDVRRGPGVLGRAPDLHGGLDAGLQAGHAADAGAGARGAAARPRSGLPWRRRRPGPRRARGVLRLDRRHRHRLVRRGPDAARGGAEGAPGQPVRRPAGERARRVQPAPSVRRAHRLRAHRHPQHPEPVARDGRPQRRTDRQPRMSGPLLPGFNPDPSVVLVDGVYHLVTSTFEYLPGLPVHRSTDLLSWELEGHVITRPEQAALEDVPTPGGVWAPTIRHRDGVYYVIVTIMMGGRGCVVYTATDPAGPWSDGVTIGAVTGIDPDLAWDDDGTAYVTFASHPSALHPVRVDLATGGALSPAMPVWTGSGDYAPEGPHLYRRGEWWYLLAAEGGTDRSHAVTIARSASPSGPFESSPANPVITARGKGGPVQNLGHADLVATSDGGEALVLLGVRPVGLAQAFSPLGRETFLADVTWDDNWPTATMRSVPPTPPERTVEHEWIAVRRTPESVATFADGRLTVVGDGRRMDDPRPS